MAKLTAPHMERCIGCFLCVLASARERGYLSFEESAIKIINQGRTFTAQIDAGVSVSGEVAKICPRNCLVLVEVTDE